MWREVARRGGLGRLCGMADKTHKRDGRKEADWESFTDGHQAVRPLVTAMQKACPSKEGRKVRALSIAMPKVAAADVAAAGRVAAMCGLEPAAGKSGLEAIARGWFEPIAKNLNGVVDADGLARTAAMVKFISLLCRGRRHSEALKEAGIDWGAVSGMRFGCRDFDKVYLAALHSMKEAMGNAVLETAFDLATVGEDVRDRRTGEVVGKKKSEKMLDRLLALSGKEFLKGGAAAQAGRDAAAVKGGGVTLTINIGGETQTLGGGQATLGGGAIDV